MRDNDATWRGPIPAAVLSSRLALQCAAAGSTDSSLTSGCQLHPIWPGAAPPAAVVLGRRGRRAVIRNERRRRDEQDRVS